LTLLILESQYCIKSQISILSYPAFVTASRIEKKKPPQKKKKKKKPKKKAPEAGKKNRVLGWGYLNILVNEKNLN